MIDLIFIRRNAPRWLILLIDLFISFISINSAYLLRFNFSLPLEYFNIENHRSLYWVIPLVLTIRLISFIISRTYAGIVRYTGTKDTERILFVIFSGSLVLLVSNFISYYSNGSFIMPLSIIGIDFLSNVFLMVAFRLFVKTLYLEYSKQAKNKKNVIIYGINEMALVTKRTLIKDVESNFKVVAFIDDIRADAHKKLDGLNIYSSEKLIELLDRFEISILIIANKDISTEKKSRVIDICLNNDVRVLTLPDVNRWINGELSIKQIRKFKIEDLLERSPIKLDEEKIKKDTLNQIVLVTGAAGSIGSEIVKQLLRFKPKLIIIFDQAESPLYELELELNEKYHFNNFEIVIGNVTNEYRIKKVFDIFKPSVVYHAAAYKHVPMMEHNPAEAIRANVLGTKIVADLALKYSINKFVMVSTDKAVNPTNVMGASKRIAEIYTQSLNGQKQTKFITTRFGNVLGSNGSVINRFRKQIEKGGPVTVTHPQITRFFMTIPEACQLVLEAGAMGKGGEVFVFDMGTSVKIADMAKKMIKLSGFELGKDIQINFTGLRPGEKLYEELLNDKENTQPTHHSQIMIGKVREYNFKQVNQKISDLISLITENDNFKIVRVMKEIVPEFKSQNSEYEIIDMEKK
ncbi:MAG: polysaccharide biosynthesis protein [Bacteroidetes bacterium]|nr:MAG: polysaccharide biosynthesis protein [Bacteroidota bacterium]